MASLVAGKYSGVYKAADLVMIKLADTGDGSFTSMAALVGYYAILADRVAHSVDGGVVSMSFAMAWARLDRFPDAPFDDPFRRLLQHALDWNIVSVMSCPNDPDEPLTERSPRRLGGRRTKHIVAGAATTNGSRWFVNDQVGTGYKDSSGKDILSVFAMADHIPVAGHLNDEEFRLSSGSSGAAAQAAGLAIFYMSKLGLKAADVKKYLVSDAVALKGLKWERDESLFLPHPRVGLGLNMVSCDPTGSVPTAPTLTRGPYQTLAGTLLARVSATFITDGPEVSLYHGRSPYLTDLIGYGTA